MSEASRQRWLFLHNRMQELNAKYGELADEPLPPWLDSLEGFYATFGAATPPESPPHAQAVLRPAEALQKLDEHGETSLFACPRCGQESAKANTRIDLWHCTACDSNGRASRLARPPDDAWVTPVNLA